MSSIDTSEEKRQHPYGPFAVAVVFYVVGVTLFSIWIYLEHRAVASAIPAAQRGSFNRVALAEGFEGIFLFLMAFVLILLHSRAKAFFANREHEINIQLQRNYEKLKKHEHELQDAVKDLERFNAVTIHREERIIELKAEVNELLSEQNQPLRYTESLQEKAD